MVYLVVGFVISISGKFGAIPCFAISSSSHCFTFTISIAIAPDGQACTQAGVCPTSSFSWHIWHLVTIPLSSLNTGTS